MDPRRGKIIIMLTITFVVLLASGCTSSTAGNASSDGIVSALESRDRTAVYIALWTLRQNGFDIPEIELEGPYSEAEPALKELAGRLAQLPWVRLRELDESYYYHEIIYSPIYSPRLGSGGKGWKDCPTSEVTTTRRSVQRHRASSAGAQAPYVQCVGRFTDYEAEYPWFENWLEEDGTPVHDDGKCPRATFRLSAPAVYEGRTVSVLYKYEGKDRPTPPPLSRKGKDFSFELPEDFFTGKSATIDNTDVRNLRVVP